MTSTPLIKTLPEHVVNQIKAGEVIERPANIVKELLENSLDAGADKIELIIKEEGLKQIIVKDNGHGMNFESLPMAFERHATSKISNFDHLYGLESFGFRGEALASVASVAKIKCISTANDKTSLIEIEAGDTIVHQALETSQGPGTQLFISDLFYNTPVRLKFNQSKKSEKRQIEKVIKIFLLSHPHVQLSVQWDEADKKLYAQSTMKHRCQQLFYKTIKSAQYPEITLIQKDYEDYSITGFLSKDSSNGYASKEQFLFINSRYFEEKKFHSLICRQMDHSWFDRSQGHYVLFITAPQHKIDVNIHPRKTQVKFQESSTLYSFISESIKSLRPISPTRTDNYEPHTNNSNSSFLNQDTSYFSSKDLTKSFQGLSSQDTSYQASFEPITTWSQVHVYQNRFVLLSSPESVFYILDSYKLALLILSQLKDIQEKPVPLLISEFITDIEFNKSEIEELQRIGFVIDEIETQQYAIRTVPKVMMNLRYQALTKSILKYFLKGTEVEFKLMPFISLQFFTKNLSDNLAYYLGEKVLVDLNNAKWKNLWT